MATGDQSDVVKRLRGYLPSRWFGDTTPLLDALLAGLGSAGAFVYSLYAYAKLQTRIATSTDGWLDVIAADFGLPMRKANQSDASFRATIKINLLRERATRNAIVKVLQDVTGRTPVIIEPQRPADTGAYGAPNIGYGAAGRYGSLLLPYQAFVQAYRPLGSGIPFVAGYGTSPGGYGVASRADYASISSVIGAVTDTDIYATIDSVKPAGTIVWASISSSPAPAPGRIGIDFIIGASALA